jgi:hypothetical protein
MRTHSVPSPLSLRSKMAVLQTAQLLLSLQCIPLRRLQPLCKAALFLLQRHASSATVCYEGCVNGAFCTK